MNAVRPTIRSLGAGIVVISPQLPRVSKDMRTRNKAWSSTVLYDSGNQTAETFGIMMRLPDELIAVYKKLGIDLVRFNGDDLWRLPVPARFVIGRGAIVRAVEADPDYTTRPEPEEALAALRALA